MYCIYVCTVYKYIYMYCIYMYCIYIYLETKEMKGVSMEYYFWHEEYYFSARERESPDKCL